MGLEAIIQQEGFVTTTIDAITGWARKSAVWPMPMGISCCAIEMMASADPKYDIARFGSEVMRFTPRQSDVMLVAGTVIMVMQPREQFPVMYLVDFGGSRELVSRNRIRA